MITKTIDEQWSSVPFEDDGAYTIKQFCALYNIGVTNTYAEIKRGRLVAKKRGKRTLITRASARAWLNTLPDAMEEKQLPSKPF